MMTPAGAESAKCELIWFFLPRSLARPFY